MSHFTVGIITRDEPTLSDITFILEPFDENKEVRHIITKQKIIDEVRRDITDYANSSYKEYLTNPEEYVKKYGSNENHIKYITEEFPQKLNWTDEECYLDGIKYYEQENILPNGDIISHYNPLSKWDWWEVGGRWNGLIQTSHGAVNKSPVSDITNLFDEKIYKNAIRYWELKVEEREQNEEDKEFLKDYHDFWNKEYYLTYYGDKETYAKCQATFSTYAYIDIYGEWHGKGDMGWWGMSNQEEDAEAKWAVSYAQMLEEAKANGYWLTIVDCHI